MKYCALPDIMKLTFWQRPCATDLGESPRMVIRPISTCRTLATLLRKSYLCKATECVTSILTQVSLVINHVTALMQYCQESLEIIASFIPPG